MLTAEVQEDTILKGERFTARVAQICSTLPEVHPLPGLKYRRILIPGILGGEIQFAQLAFIAHALRVRGAEVTGLLCDAFLPACTARKVDHYESACTRWCHKNSGPFIQAARLSHRWYSEFITRRERNELGRVADHVPSEELRTFEYRGVPLGAHVDRSIESYFKVGKFDLDNPKMVTMARKFLTSALCLTVIGERVLEELKIDKVFMEDGEKTDWGVFREVARHRGIPVEVILGAPRGNSLLIERDRHPEPNDQMPLWPKWKDLPLTESQNAELDEYFSRRAARPYEDHNWTATAQIADPADIRREIGLPSSQSGLIFAIFPNLSYDAKLTTRCPTYDTAAEWVAETVRFFQRWPEHHLVVKIHPSETIQQALDPTLDYLADNFPALPDNVHVLPPETHLMAQDVLRVADVALVYTSTVGVEAAYLGKPVVNVGGGWHAARGYTMDVTRPEQYLDILADICAGRRSCDPPKELGRRYAYAVFFRGLLPIRHFSAIYPRITGLQLNSLDDLAPGRDPTMDVVCRGVLLNEPFCREEERR